MKVRLELGYLKRIKEVTDLNGERLKKMAMEKFEIK